MSLSKHIEPQIIRKVLCGDNFPALAYVLIWNELDENSESFRVLSRILFDHDAVDNPENAPIRTVTPAIRSAVADCVLKYTEAYFATE